MKRKKAIEKAIIILLFLFAICGAILFVVSADAAPKKKKKAVPFSDLIGYKFCQDKENFDCMIVKEITVDAEIVRRGRKAFVKKNIPQTWETLFPDSGRRELTMKLNRLNVELKIGMPIAVPKDPKKTLADFSPFPKWIKAPEEKVLIFDPALLSAAAYSPQGKLLRWMPATGGMDRCLDTWRRCRTVVGEWRIIVMGDENSHSHIYPIGCPRKEPCAPMPWYVKFERKYGYGFHGSEKMKGKHASHGCVRLFTDDAKWLNQHFVQKGTKVITRKYPSPNRS